MKKTLSPSIQTLNLGLLFSGVVLWLATVQANELAPEEDNIERIEVLGQRWLPQTLGAEGQFTLNREFLDNALKGNGNVTDMLLFLPGVQGSESALNVNEQAEIRSKLLSISGAQPWQTAFVLEGLSNNSLLDPGSSGRSPTAVNDVQGHPEATFVNQELVAGVTVYDSNIPARFGGFNGGVVDMQLRDPAHSPRFSINYRRSNSSWGSYHFIDQREYNDDAEAEAKNVDWPQSPNFDKETLSFTTSSKIGDRQALTFSLARTTSIITDISLQEPIQTERESISSAFTYQIDDFVVDRIRVHAGYSPYTGQHIITNVKDSDFELRGGGRNLSIQLQHRLWQGDWKSALSWSESENSRTAPSLFLPWIRAQGKLWGVALGQPPLSVEGGYGNLDKTQQRYSFSSSFQRHLGEYWGAYSAFEVGVSVEELHLQRDREQPTAQYSAAWRDANIRCNGQFTDCIEQQFSVPLAELAEALGGEIDFGNPEHVRAYEQNLISRGQFFRYRRLYLEENIHVQLMQTGLYGEVNLDWPRLNLSLGFRADHDDFLENLNVAYRTRASVDLWGDQESTVVMGLNRYYTTNLLTYQLREAQRPYVTQYRTVSNGEVGRWLTSAQAQRFRYRFDNVRTPYSDEAMLGFRQQINLFQRSNAMLSLTYVQRRGYDQITRGAQEIIDGITYLYQTNEGSNRHDRISLSYNQAWQNHALTFNLNFTENETSAESYDNTVVGVPEDELVVLQSLADTYRLVSYDDLTRRQMDFSRPITANLVWNARWHEQLRTTLSAAYVSKFDTITDSGLLFEVDRPDLTICQRCTIESLTYPLFREYQRPERLTFNGRVEYQVPLVKGLQAAVNLEVTNLFNERSYLIGQGMAGIEVGREFWLGVNLSW
ncbi:hypothetical protein [Aliidiomarina celeris]|uniref:hypothetical protein n=1 Tax=Aliidiomarina celeris TaxID=2249428 RepID=UPI000DE8FF5F|nr:hypothetical protein [Aliidiomarina celeris]